MCQRELFGLVENKNERTTAVLRNWGLGVYREEPVFALSSSKRGFSFNLFGIFVSSSNKNPQLLKAGGTLAVILRQQPYIK